MIQMMRPTRSLLDVDPPGMPGPQCEINAATRKLCQAE